MVIIPRTVHILLSKYKALHVAIADSLDTFWLQGQILTVLS
jgi:hypothetical protein